MWSIAADAASESFSYTVGIYDICGQPEIITVGLSAGTAHHALNEAAKLLRAGVDLAKGRHSDLVGEVDVEFRPVDAKWLHHIMLRAHWYYKEQDVPVLQLIYPDLQNRFPGEPDFDEAFAQPYLSGERGGDGTVADDLWLSHDKKSSLSRWKFSDGPHVAAYLSQTVFDGTEPITYVSHDSDGDWQFLGDRMSEGGGPVVACLHHSLDNDRTIEELHDLPLNWYATREHTSAPWQRFEHPPREPEADDVAEPPESTLLN